MALSEDQKAMLRLLAQRGEQGYDDIAALKGLGTDEVRAQVREAVRQLEDEGLPPPAIPGLDAAEEAPPPAPAKPEPEAPKPEPVADKPAPPTPAPPKREAPAPRSDRPKFSLPSDPGVRGALLAGALVALALVVVLIVSGGGGEDSEGAGTTTAATAQEGAAGNAPVTTAKGITKAELSAVGGGDASGAVVFGRVKNSLALQVEASGLEPTGKGQSYAIWLSQTPKKMLPLAATPVGKSGRIAAQFEVPVEVLGYLANETFEDIAITLVDEEDLQSSLAAATKAEESPAYTGTEVLRGTVVGPIVGAAKK